MASPACCAAGKPLVHEYTREGEMLKIGDMDVYVVGSGKAAIIVMHDIFGHDFNQVFQVCDRLSEAGYVVASPELFDHKPWQMSNFPPSDKDEFMNFINGPGNTQKVTGQVKATMEWLKANKGVLDFALQGHCWSSTISLYNAGSGDFKAVSCNHPAFFGKEKEYAEAARCPVAIIPAGGDPGEDAYAILQTKPFGDKCVLQRFDDMEHGFLAARGDWENPKVSEDATKALGVLIEFYTANLPPQA